MDSDEYKYQQMQDEMSRFEAEIAGERPSRAVIGSATYSVHQRIQQGNVPGPLLPSPSSYMSAIPSLPEPPHFIPPLLQSKPQPAVLSGAPQLYKNKMEKQYKDTSRYAEMLPIVREYESPSPAIPTMTPVVPLPPVDTPSHHAAVTYIHTNHKPSKKEKKNRKVIRTAGGQVWEDLSLMDWPDDDFRLFCGDLGNDVTDELLIRTFSKYSSFSRAKVIRDKRTNKSKGFGFISFREPADFIKAMKEMNGRYVGSRPIKLRKSTWRARSLDVVRKKEKEKAALISMLTGGTQKS